MTDPKQIPHLIKLLDDESSNIRITVAKELAAFGPTLQNELIKTGLSLNPTQRGYVGKILEEHKRVWLKHAWPNWLNLTAHKGNLIAHYDRLEGVLSILAEFLNGIEYNIQLKSLLDELAQAYKTKYHENSPGRLAKFLFKEKGLQGDEDDYYNSQNNNLVYVIKKKKGIPISLASVYMLVGHRLGMRIEGCHFPGHFLARINIGGTKLFVDCFNGGQIIEESDLLSIKEETFKGMKKILHEKTDVQMIVRTYLANLIRSYQIKADKENSQLLIKLFNDMDMYTNSKMASELTPEDIIYNANPPFKPGQCVSHARYGYRGIIVDADQDCMATDEWFYGNQTQPSRHQPWYHVLVHGSDQVTYVAQNNLLKDTSIRRVKHPLISHFFTKTEEGHYIRNENLWPETDF